ncbi:ras guanine nucleotide exchange factor domain-containing protein [Umbelopsis sp. PMI_123]|nr:ras guanine nucleotide exchange factor domain-containing protein [Umbelopsis sp. PMI_123]
MNPPRVLCRVQAIYAYQSGDPSALSFAKGDIIEVLTQLESGWWDGWCNGLRGWFPSNYVEVIDNEPEMIAGDFGLNQSISAAKQYNNHQPNDNQWFDENDFHHYNDSQHHQQQQFRELSARSKEQLRLSLASSDRSYSATPTTARSRSRATTNHSESSSMKNGLPPNWVKQTTEDGSGFYYYNMVTHKMRYTHPNEPEEEEESMDDFSDNDMNEFRTYNENGHTSPDMTASVQSRSQLPQEQPVSESEISQDEDLSDREFEPRIPPRSANRIKVAEKFVDDHSLASSGNQSRLSSVSSQGTQNKYLRDNDEQYPPNWTKKMTPQGRPYYCNMLTNETTWNIEDVDPTTGELLIQPGTPTQSTVNEPVNGSIHDSESKRSSDHSQLSRKKVVELQANEPLGWGKLSSLIAHAIHDLNSAARNGQRHLYRDLTTAVVESIRLMLYTSNSIDKENSPHLKNDKNLRTQYRAIMAALSKLVLSAKLASTMWSPPDAVVKMETDANDVLVAVRNFLGSAQEACIEIQDTDPRLLENGATSIASLQWRRKRNNSQSSGRGPTNELDEPQPRFFLHPEQVAILQNSATSMHSTIMSFIEYVRKVSEKNTNSKELSSITNIQSATPLIIAQFRNLGNIVSQFLNHVEDIAVDDSLTHVGDLKFAKQSLYNSMGSLFVATQFVTNDSPSPDELEASVAQVEQCATSVEESVWDICRAVSKLTTERLSKAPASGASQSPTPTRSAQKTPPTSHQIRDANDLLAWKIPETSLSIDTGKDVSQDFFSTQDEDGRISPDTDISERDELDDILASPDDDLMSQPLSQRSMSDNALNRRPDDKVKKFFGEEVAVAANRRDTTIGPASTMSTMTSAIGAPSALSVPETPWYLGYDYTPNDIVFNMEGQVKGGTLTALVERLTLHDFLDSKFINTFLLTYRSFCTTDEWFDLLMQRYNLPAPAGLTPEEIDIWGEKKLKLVRLRVFNVIKTWLENFYNEEEDQHIIARIMEFAEVTIRESMQFASEQLIKLVRKRMDTDDNSQFRKMTLTTGTPAPPAILPKNMKRVRLLDIDPLEIARQLTVMDSRLYIKIKPVECLDKNWGKEDSENIAANVKASIEYSNQITAWVTDSILSQTEIKKRCAIIKHWVQVAEKCRILNNFNTCMAVLSAFDNSAIGRLKRTWDSVSARTMQTLAYIRKLMGANKNFNEYREIIHSVNPPCIPFLGIYLQDLTFIEDGNTNFLRKSNQLINFAKRMKTAEVIREIQQYQSSPYFLNAVPELQVFITTHLQSSRDEETCYNLSLALEPREREDEKIARLLKESGFS